MCESSVYVKEDGEEKLIAKEVVSLIPRENGFIFIIYLVKSMKYTMSL